MKSVKSEPDLKSGYGGKHERPISHQGRWRRRKLVAMLPRFFFIFLSIPAFAQPSEIYTLEKVKLLKLVELAVKGKLYDSVIVAQQEAITKGLKLESTYEVNLKIKDQKIENLKDQMRDSTELIRSDLRTAKRETKRWKRKAQKTVIIFIAVKVVKTAVKFALKLPNPLL